jgi:CHAT domain-containing protein
MSRHGRLVLADTRSAFDVRIRTLCAVGLVVQAIPWPSHAALVTANAACAAAWIPEPSDVVRWSRIDATQGVLTIGTEIVARLDLLEAGIALRARDHPRMTLPGAVVAENDEAARLKVEARLPIDSSCVVSIRGVVERSSDSRLADQAAAWVLAGDAADAEQGDETERASQLATRAFQALSAVTTSEFPQKLEFAALAAERLLRAGHRDAASELLSIGADAQAVHLPDGHPSRLRFELARARALSFSDRNEEALGLRLALQPKVLTIFGSASNESLSNRLRIANLRLELGDTRQARVELESLRESINRVRNPGDALRISTIRALANALALLDLGKDSVELLDQLRVELIIAHGPNDGRVIDVEEQIARMQTRLEQFEIALQGASKVFLWRTGNLGFSNVRTLQSAWMLALLYKEFGRYDTARALVSALLEESNRVATNVPTQLKLRTLSVLGSIEGAQGNVDAAEEILRSAWRQYAAIVGENSDDTARALMSYALLLVQNGRVDRICPVVRETFDESRIAVRSDLQLKALSKILGGLCLLTESRSAGAVQQGLARLEGGWNDLRSREGAGSSTAMYALSTLAWANFRIGNRQAAKRLLQELIGLAEQSRRLAPAGSYTRDYWFSRWITDHSQNLGYRTLALLYAEDGELDEAVRISELARDRRLRDRLFERAWLSARLPADARDQLRALTSEIEGLDERLALEANIVERVRLESRRILAVAGRDDFEKRVSERYRIEPLRVELPSLAQLRELLDAGTAVASIQLSGDRWWAVVIAGDSPVRFVALDHEPDLDVAMRAWVSLLGGAPLRAWPVPGNRLVVSYERPAPAIGHHLSGHALAERVARAILLPLVSAAPQARHLVIVADDDLNGIPFGAMPIDGAPAIDRLEISYAPSLGTYAALCRSAGQRAWARDLLSFAADDVVEMRSVPNDGIDTGPYGDSTRLMLEYASRHPLPFASKEAEAASANFAPVRTTIMRGSEASKARLAEASANGSLAQYRYVHIAAHAFSFPHDPERSMLILNGPAAADAAARVLTAAELANLQMGSELLVLAACGTGVGHYEPGQGLLGFAFAALAAGNHAAVLSLWEVADDLTQRFMSSFFERLKQGMRPSTALSATQREFAHRPDPRVNDPSIWAAFVLYGQP